MLGGFDAPWVGTDGLRSDLNKLLFVAIAFGAFCAWQRRPRSRADANNLTLCLVGENFLFFGEELLVWGAGRGRNSPTIPGY